MKNVSTFLVDAVSIRGGMPSSGGLRGVDGRMLTQYFNPRPYQGHSLSKSGVKLLGTLGGVGFFLLSTYFLYKIETSDDSSFMFEFCETGHRCIHKTDTISKDGVESIDKSPRTIYRTVKRIPYEGNFIDLE